MAHSFLDLEHLGKVKYCHRLPAKIPLYFTQHPVSYRKLIMLICTERWDMKNLPFIHSWVYSLRHAIQWEVRKVPCASTTFSAGMPATCSNVSMFCVKEEERFPMTLHAGALVLCPIWNYSALYLRSQSNWSFCILVFDVLLQQNGYHSSVIFWHFPLSHYEYKSRRKRRMTM